MATTLESYGSLLSINTEFYGKHVKGTIRVTGISSITNTMSVEITSPGGNRWAEDDWNLQHVIWGFEKKEYSFTKYE